MDNHSQRMAFSPCPSALADMYTNTDLLSTPAILGIDFLRKHVKSIDHVAGGLLMRPPEEARAAPTSKMNDVEVTAASQAYVPPRSSKWIRCCAPVDQNCVGFVESDYRLLETALIDVKQHQSFRLLLHNATDEPVLIPKGQHVGVMAIVADDQLVPVQRLQRPEGATFAPPTAQKKQLIHEACRAHGSPQFKQQVLDLLIEFADVVSDNDGDLGYTDKVKHAVYMKSREPIHIKQFRIPEEHLQLLNDHVTKLLHLKCITLSTSPYNAPIFCVKKPGGGLRVVQDFRAINEHSYDDKYTIKDIQECIDNIGKAKSRVFTTLDLTSGFWQMALDEASQDKTAFTVPGRGRFHWLVTPMGLKGSPASFQRLMDHVMRGAANIQCYIDDVLVHSQSEMDHVAHLRDALTRLRKFHLKLNLKKCEFGREKVPYLGHVLSAEGVTPSMDKLKAVRDFPEPKTEKAIREFCGLTNYFRNHIRNFSLLSGQLTRLTRKESDWKGGPLPMAAKAAFEQLKQRLCSAPMLAYPLMDRPFFLSVDAATGTEAEPGGLGAILSQYDENYQEKVVAYASRSLKPFEQNYTPFLLEMAAACWAIDHFHPYLWGRRFTLVTDHKPLEKLGTLHQKTLNRLQEQMNKYNFVILYRKGEDNEGPDALSRNPVDALEATTTDLRLKQQNDSLTGPIIEFLENKFLPTNKKMAVRVKDLALRCQMQDGLLYFKHPNRIGGQEWLLFIPSEMTQDVIRAHHVSRFAGHAGPAKTVARIQERYYWPGMVSHTQAFVAQCLTCQKSAQPRQATLTSPLHSLNTPDGPNQRVHADLFGPLNTPECKNKYVLVITDAFTKYAVCVAIPDKTAPIVAEAIFRHWISIFSVPKTLCTDQGKEFCNQVLDELSVLLGLERMRTAAMHPQTNAAAEVFNKTLTRFLAKMLEQKSTLTWEEQLPALMLSYNTQVHRATLQTPFYLTFLHHPNMPFFDMEVARPNYAPSWQTSVFQTMAKAHQLAKTNMQQLQRENEELYNKSTTQRSFTPGQEVLVFFRQQTQAEAKGAGTNAKLLQPWKDGFVVIRRVAPDTYLLKNTRTHRNTTVNIDRIKPLLRSGVDSKSNTPWPPISNSADTGADPKPDLVPREHAEDAEEARADHAPNQARAKRAPKTASAPPMDRRITRSMAKKIDQSTMDISELDIVHHVQGGEAEAGVGIFVRGRGRYSAHLNLGSAGRGRAAAAHASRGRGRGGPRPASRARSSGTVGAERRSGQQPAQFRSTPRPIGRGRARSSTTGRTGGAAATTGTGRAAAASGTGSASIGRGQLRPGGAAATTGTGGRAGGPATGGSGTGSTSGAGGRPSSISIFLRELCGVGIRTGLQPAEHTEVLAEACRQIVEDDRRREANLRREEQQRQREECTGPRLRITRCTQTQPVDHPDARGRHPVLASRDRTPPPPYADGANPIGGPRPRIRGGGGRGDSPAAQPLAGGAQSAGGPSPPNNPGRRRGGFPNSSGPHSARPAASGETAARTPATTTTGGATPATTTTGGARPQRPTTLRTIDIQARPQRPTTLRTIGIQERPPGQANQEVVPVRVAYRTRFVPCLIAAGLIFTLLACARPVQGHEGSSVFHEKDKIIIGEDTLHVVVPLDWTNLVEICQSAPGRCLQQTAKLTIKGDQNQQLMLKMMCRRLESACRAARVLLRAVPPHLPPPAAPTRRQIHQARQTPTNQSNAGKSRPKRQLALGVALVSSLFTAYEEAQIIQLQAQAARMTASVHGALVRLDKHETRIAKLEEDTHLLSLALIEEQNMILEDEWAFYKESAAMALTEHIAAIEMHVNAMSAAWTQLLQGQMPWTVLAEEELTRIETRIMSAAQDLKGHAPANSLFGIIQFPTSFAAVGANWTAVLHVPIIKREWRMLTYIPTPIPRPEAHDAVMILHHASDNVLLIDQDQGQHLEVSRPKLDAICSKRGEAYICGQLGATRRKLASSCLGALYANKPEAAASLCPTTRISGQWMTVQTDVDEILLWANQTLTVDLNCPTNATNWKAKGLSTVRIGQGCTLMTDHFLYRAPVDRTLTLRAVRRVQWAKSSFDAFWENLKSGVNSPSANRSSRLQQLQHGLLSRQPTPTTPEPLWLESESDWPTGHKDWLILAAMGLWAALITAIVIWSAVRSRSNKKSDPESQHHRGRQRPRRQNRFRLSNCRTGATNGTSKTPSKLSFARGATEASAARHPQPQNEATIEVHAEDEVTDEETSHGSVPPELNGEPDNAFVNETNERALEMLEEMLRLGMQPVLMREALRISRRLNGQMTGQKKAERRHTGQGD